VVEAVEHEPDSLGPLGRTLGIVPEVPPMARIPIAFVALPALVALHAPAAAAAIVVYDNTATYRSTENALLPANQVNSTEHGNTITRARAARSACPSRLRSPAVSPQGRVPTGTSGARCKPPAPFPR
jgi:hypothetical protein